MADYKEHVLPNGQMARFPSSMTDEQIQHAITANFPKEEKEGIGERAFRLGVKDPLIGLANFGHGLLNAPHNIVRGLEDLGRRLGDIYSQNIPGPSVSSKRLSDLIPKQENYNFAEMLGQKGSGTSADQAIQTLTEIAPSFLLPSARLGSTGKVIERIPKVGKLAERITAEAIPQAAFAATQSEDPIHAAEIAGAVTTPFTLTSQLAKSSSPKVRTAAKIAAGGLGAIAGKEAAELMGFKDSGETLGAIIGGVLGGRGMQTKKGLIKDALEGVDPQISAERLAASKRLGLDYLTPAEASLSPAVAERQGSLGKTPEGSRLLYEKGQRRAESEEGAINRLLDTIYHEETHGPEMVRAYADVYPLSTTPELAQKYKDNEIVKHAQKIVESNPAYKEELKGLGKDTIGYWDLVKRAMDDMAENSPRSEQRIIRKANQHLRSDLDEIAPDYKKARDLARRQAARDKLEKNFNKKALTGLNMYKAIEDKTKFSQLMNQLHDVPKAQQMLSDMRMVFKDLIGTPSIRTAAQLKKTSMTEARNPVQALQEVAKNIFTSGKNEKAVIDFITSPNWHDAFRKYATMPEGISKKQMNLAELIKKLGRPSSQIAASD